jgi:hypothetical protein
MFYMVLILKVKYFVTILTVNIMNLIDGEFFQILSLTIVLIFNPRRD